MNAKSRPLSTFILLFLIGCSFSLLAQTNSDNDGSTPTDTLYEYWIKFPADVKTECLSDLVIPGVSYEEIGCDLLAVGNSDEFFSVNEDSTCYKIFRTYRIINWCEYDGIAAPVVVGRDWDNWNGTNPGRCGLGLPDGNNEPGDSDFYIYVKRNLADTLADTVWYDADMDPHNAFPDNPATDDVTEGYWWKVVSGGWDPSLESYYEGGCSVWSYDLNQTDSDISGNVARDDNDFRFGSFGYWIYTQHISVYDDIVPTVSINGDDLFPAIRARSCDAEVSFEIITADSCNNRNLRVEIGLDTDQDGEADQNVTNLWDGQTFSGDFELGTYRLIVEVYDDCGNGVVAEKDFEVADRLAPAPICQQNLLVRLHAQDDGLVSGSIKAIDFQASPIFDCTGQNRSQSNAYGGFLINSFSINRIGETPFEDQRTLSLDCDDYRDSVIMVEIHAWDEAGNHDFCRSNLRIQADTIICNPADTIPMDTTIIDTVDTDTVETFGLVAKVYTEQEANLEDVEVVITGDTSVMLVTNEEGEYLLQGQEKGKRITIIPSLEKDYKNGVSTIDMIRIRKYILGEEVLTSPYQLLAADLDDNGTINILDMIRIRKLILGLDEGMLYNRVWRFIPVEFIFNDPQDPWANGFPETITYEFGSDDNRYAGSFIALKVGDVNGSAMTQVEERSSAKSSLLINDQQLIAGRSYEVSVAIEDASSLEGLQFSLGWDTKKVSLESIDGAEMEEEEMAFLAKHQLVTGSWINTKREYAKEPTLFRLKIKAKQNVMLHEVIHLSNRITKSEAYNNKGQIQSLALAFRPEANLSWNINNNPFYNETQLNFSEPISGTIQIFDNYGRLRLQQTIEANSNFRLYKSDLGGAGTYFFSVTTANQKVNGKFIAL